MKTQERSQARNTWQPGIGKLLRQTGGIILAPTPPVHRKKGRDDSCLFLYGIRQRPILPGRVQPSTFGTEGLNCCVRDGNRWNPFVIATGNGELFSCRALLRLPGLPFRNTVPSLLLSARPRILSASRLSHCSTLSLPCQVRFSLPLTSPLLRAPLLPAP